MVKPITGGWYEVFTPAKGRAWFRTYTECVLWAFSDELG